MRRGKAKPEPAPVPTGPDPTPSRPGHTSIVYFHGMGTPRRYEELSRVLDSLDRYAESLDGERDTTGRLRGQEVRWEPSRVDGGAIVAFLEFLRMIWIPGRTPEDRLRPQPVGTFRLYESYWSPAAAGGMSAHQVGLWILLRVFTPFAVWRRRWRAHQRFKLSFLNRMAYDRNQQPMPVARYQRLASLYRSFESMDARRCYPKGSTKDFRDHIADGTGVGGKEREDLLALAKRWQDEVNASQLQVLLIGLTALAATFGIISICVGLVYRALAVIGSSPGPERLEDMALRFPPWMALICLAMAVPVFVYGRRFFRNFLADVVFWTTTFEKDVRYQKRRDILHNCEATLRHVMCDPGCDRVVIVGHSLGTAIAYETLLNLGRRVTADREGGIACDATLDADMRKISHVITFGSPIDRIAYFFNLAYSRYHRFNRVRDDLLGHTGDLPFEDDRTRRIQWINVRDPADPIASRLFAPRGRIPNREEILEIEVSSSHVPNPAGAHVGYFDAALSAKLLFDACILNRPQAQAQQDRTAGSRSFAKGARRAAWGAAFVQSWLLGLGGMAFWCGWPLIATLTQTVFCVVFVGLLALIWLGKAFDAREPLVLPA